MENKRLDGRDEPIIEPDRPIIDAHHHLWLHPTLPYMIDDYIEDAAAGHNLVASVYVETQAFMRAEGPELLRPLGEIEFANGVAAMTHSGALGKFRACAAIVGYADMRMGSAVGSLLDRGLQTAPDRFRGIRQPTTEYPTDALNRYILHPPPRGIMKSAGFIPALKELERRGLTFDAAIFHTQLADLAEIADAVPDLKIVLNHMGMPVAIGLDDSGQRQVFRDWRLGLEELAKRPNVFCKISGLGLPFWGFGFEHQDSVGYLKLSSAWKPFIETAITTFGPSRCMMASNFSADARSCGFVPLWNALKHAVADASEDEKSALFYETAAAFYRVSVAP